MKVIDLFSGSAPDVGATKAISVNGGFGRDGRVSKGLLVVTGVGITDWSLDLFGAVVEGDAFQRVQRVTHGANSPYFFEVILAPQMYVQVLTVNATNLDIKLLV